jgi:hypothetical protein
MTIFGRRVGRLERAAREIRMRSFIVELAEERGIAADRLLAEWQACRARTAELRTRGMRVDEIMAATAARLGIGVDDLRARCEALAERFKL